MTEVDREEFLADRAEAQNEAANRAAVGRMVALKERQEGRGSDDDGDEEGEEGVRRTPRDRNASGKTKANAKAMQKLKKARADKKKKKGVSHALSPLRRIPELTQCESNRTMTRQTVEMTTRTTRMEVTVRRKIPMIISQRRSQKRRRKNPRMLKVARELRNRTRWRELERKT